MFFPLSLSTLIPLLSLVSLQVRLLSCLNLTSVSAAYEVYVRRAYRAYTLLSLDYEEGDGEDEAPSAVTWRFKLGRSNSPPVTPAITPKTDPFTYVETIYPLTRLKSTFYPGRSNAPAQSAILPT